MAKVKTTETKNEIKFRPALTPEADEEQCISLAMDLVKRRLADGSASAQETVHFLKQATFKSRLENERLELENDLIKAKTEALNSAARVEALYMDAIKAFKTYNGQGDICDDDLYDE